MHSVVSRVLYGFVLKYCTVVWSNNRAGYLYSEFPLAFADATEHDTFAEIAPESRDAPPRQTSNIYRVIICKQQTAKATRIHCHLPVIHSDSPIPHVSTFSPL